MEALGKTLVVRRGEEFVYQREIVDDNGVPYRLWALFPKHVGDVRVNLINNPYLLIKIASNTYRQDGRYEMNYWLDISGYKYFEATMREPVFVTNEQLSAGTLPDGIGSNSTILLFVDEGKNYYGYNLTDSKYEPYSFTFTKHFLPVQTAEWVEQDYTYEISIKGGTLMSDYLTSLYKSVFPDKTPPTDNRTLYEQVKLCRPDLVKDINYDAPIVAFDYDEIIQAPSKLRVLTNN